MAGIDALQQLCDAGTAAGAAAAEEAGHRGPVMLPPPTGTLPPAGAHAASPAGGSLPHRGGSSAADGHAAEDGAPRATSATERAVGIDSDPCTAPPEATQGLGLAAERLHASERSLRLRSPGSRLLPRFSASRALKSPGPDGETAAGRARPIWLTVYTGAGPSSEGALNPKLPARVPPWGGGAEAVARPEGYCPAAGRERLVRLAAGTLLPAPEHHAVRSAGGGPSPAPTPPGGSGGYSPASRHAATAARADQPPMSSPCRSPVITNGGHRTGHRGGAAALMRSPGRDGRPTVEQRLGLNSAAAVREAAVVHLMRSPSREGRPSVEQRLSPCALAAAREAAAAMPARSLCREVREGASPVVVRRPYQPVEQWLTLDAQTAAAAAAAAVPPMRLSPQREARQPGEQQPSSGAVAAARAAATAAAAGAAAAQTMRNPSGDGRPPGAPRLGGNPAELPGRARSAERDSEAQQPGDLAWAAGEASAAERLGMRILMMAEDDGGEQYLETRRRQVPF